MMYCAARVYNLVRNLNFLTRSENSPPPPLILAFTLSPFALILHFYFTFPIIFPLSSRHLFVLDDIY
jgi:hypothetical protein